MLKLTIDHTEHLATNLIYNATQNPLVRHGLM